MRPQDFGQELLEFLSELDTRRFRHRPHRLPHDSYAATDCEYFFTICTRDRMPVFHQTRIAEQIVEALLWRQDRHRWTLYCYCLMPDHLHFVMRLPDEVPMPRNLGNRPGAFETVLEQVGHFKEFTTTQIWWKAGNTGALWQRSSHDRVLRVADSVEAACAYVLNNPVRKGLVSAWDEYAYSGIVDDWR